MEKPQRTNAPFERKEISTTSVMTDVIVAFFPIMLAAGYIFGGRGLMLTGTCMIMALVFDFLCSLIFRHKGSAGDLSSVVTGLLFAMCLPPTFPFLKAILGILISVAIAKHLFGGLGKNIFNPAAFGLVTLMLLFRDDFKSYPIPFYNESDVITGATPLAKQTADYASLFLGNVSGAIGETCAAAILIGGMFLIARKTINPVTPFAFAGTVFVIAYLRGNDAVYQILSGGLLLGAFFMATDPVTTPITGIGKLIFGIGCGVLTYIFRQYTPFTEGVAFAVLIMNIFSKPIDSLIITLKKNPWAGKAAEQKTE